MTNKEVIERLENLKVKAEVALSNSNTSCEWLKEDVKGTITAFTMAIEALEKPKWNKTSEVKPTEEKEYLCCSIYNNRPHFTVLGWSNDLYEVSEFDFYDHKGESGFYSYDSEWGYIKSDCDYWQEIEWEDEE